MSYRRERREEEEKHDRWLISYADFITLMFALFVVMYAISQVNEGKYRVLSESLSTAFTEQLHVIDTRPTKVAVVAPPPTAPVPKPAPAPAPEAVEPAAPSTSEIVTRDLLVALSPMVAQGQAKVQQTERGIAIDISASALFDPGQAVVQSAALPALRAAAGVLAKVPNKLLVEGHTDNIPIHTSAYPTNWELSSARAASVVRLFIDQGVAAERLAAVGYAEYHPVQSNDSSAGRASNRRVTVVLVAAGPGDKDGLTLTLAPQGPRQ